MERNVEDVYEPLSRYRDEFRARHAALTRAKFEELSRQSQVDIRLNRRLSAEVGRLEAQAGSARGWLWLLGFLILLFFGAAGVCGLVLDRDAGPADNGVRAGLVAGLVAGVFAGIAAVVAFSRQFGRLNELKKRRIETQRRAGKLLEPLFRLFRWELPVKLIEASVPRLAFDPYFTAKRLQDLHELCGWSDAFNDGKSVLGSLSGVINGNPFVFADCLVAGWGTQTYRGSRRGPHAPRAAVRDPPRLRREALPGLHARQAARLWQRRRAQPFLHPSAERPRREEVRFLEVLAEAPRAEATRGLLA